MLTLIQILEIGRMLNQIRGREGHSGADRYSDVIKKGYPQNPVELRHVIIYKGDVVVRNVLGRKCGSRENRNK